MSADVVVGYAATKKIAGTVNFELSLNKYGWVSHRLGAGEAWKGWRQRMQMYLDFCKSQPENQCILLCDADDVLCLKSFADLLTLFKSFNKPLVISAEENCGGNCQAVDNYWAIPEHQETKSKTVSFYVNGGGMIGYAWKLCELFQWELDQGFEDDQIALGAYVNAFPSDVYLDYMQQIFLTMNPDRLLLYEYDAANNRHEFYDSKFERTYSSYFIHFTGFPFISSMQRLVGVDSEHLNLWNRVSSNISGHDKVEPHVHSAAMSVNRDRILGLGIALCVAFLLLLLLLFLYYRKISKQQHEQQLSADTTQPLKNTVTMINVG